VKFYVIRFASGDYAQGTYWKSTKDLSRAKIYGSISRAKQAMTCHQHSACWKDAKIVAFDVTESKEELNGN
jgi:hypothetical protein